LSSPPDPAVAEAPREIVPPTLSLATGVLPAASHFLRASWRRVASISALLLVPCFWHREIEAADLGSHLYNAWLVQLIHGGQIHGLWIDHRWNNVLFDYLLSGFGGLFGLRAGEKIAVALAVLIFFWGAFALVCAAARRVPWRLLPLIAMAAYGWTFHIGLFNYYLALGLSFFGLAILWSAKGHDLLIPLALGPLVFLAHPLGLLWLVGAGAYVLVAERVPRRYQLVLLPAAVAALFGLHKCLWAHFIVESRPNDFYFFNGADQFVLFGNRYNFVEYAFLIFVVGGLAWDVLRRLRRRGGGSWADYLVSIELYALVCAAVLLLPRGAHVPGHIGAVALLTDRLTSVSVVLLICLLGVTRPQKWHLAGAAAIAAVFFTFVYQDTGRINRMESEVARLVRTLPPSQRVMGTILPPPDSRVTIQHILDRACLGYCFSYGNYEPGSKMFRVRANPGNPYVLDNYDLAVEMEDGDYVVKSTDLPVYQVYQCGPDDAKLCIHSLKAGEENDDLGIHPDDSDE
jgi:hypothetical protein